MKHTLKEIELNNGAKGLLIHVPGVEVVRILAEFRAGFDLNSWDKYELPHVVEHMMFTNETYPAPRQFSREIERNGAFNNAYTNSTSLEYDYECAHFEAERIAKLLAIQITEPIFPDDELSTEKGNVEEELNSNLSNPGRSAQYNLFAAASGVPTLQTRIQQLDSITSDNLKDHYQKTHTAGNMRFIVAGDIDFDILTSVLDTANLPKGYKRLDLPHIKTRHLEDPIVEIRDIPQIYYGIFSAYPKRFSYREVVAARIMTSLLSNGFSSTLYGTARERGLVYGLSMGASFDTYETGFTFGGAVSPEHADDYFDLVREEVGKVLSGQVDKEQFESTKTTLRGQRATQYQKLSNLIGYYDSYFTTGYEPFEYYDELLDEITLEESQKAFTKLLKNDCWGVSFVGNIDEKQASKYQNKLATLFTKAS